MKLVVVKAAARLVPPEANHTKCNEPDANAPRHPLTKFHQQEVRMKRILIAGTIVLCTVLNAHAGQTQAPSAATSP
jgi:hypothetical protein